MFQTPEECKKAWEAAGKHGTPAERIERNNRWIQYYSYAARQQDADSAAFSPYAEEVVSFLEQTGRLQAEDSVLDLGSGTGSFSFSFAKHCRTVTAMDMDADSLTVLEQRARRLGLSNIRTETAMWEEYRPAQPFSVVFSSMCPAICNYEELLRMEQLAARTCCLIAVTRGSYDLHRKKLMQLLDVHPQGGMTTEALWYYEMLYLMGRQPDVKNYTRHYRYQLPVEEAVEQGTVYYQIFGLSPAQSRPVLEEYYRAVAVDGMVQDESHLNTALICWQPQK